MTRKEDFGWIKHRPASEKVMKQNRAIHSLSSLSQPSSSLAQPLRDGYRRTVCDAEAAWGGEREDKMLAHTVLTRHARSLDPSLGPCLSLWMLPVRHILTLFFEDGGCLRRVLGLRRMHRHLFSFVRRRSGPSLKHFICCQYCDIRLFPSHRQLQAALPELEAT